MVGCGSSLTRGTDGTGTRSLGDGSGGTGGTVDASGVGGRGGGGVGGVSGDSGADAAAAQGTPYACAGDFVVAVDGGVDAAPDAASAPICVVGRTFCYVHLPRPDTAGLETTSCRDFGTGGVAACAPNPTCACLCDTSHGGFYCNEECRCTEKSGLATVACQSI